MELSLALTSVSFSQTITDFWGRRLCNGRLLHSDSTFGLTVNPDLEEDSRVMLLQETDARVMAVVTPQLENKLGLAGQPVRSIEAFRQRLSEFQVILNGADWVFYFSAADKQSLEAERPGGPRKLTAGDQGAFARFQSSASERDLDDAWVELNHWAVFGAFEQERLVSATSAYPWGGAWIADIGVLTLEPFRARGHARRLVRSIGRYALDHGY